jgi:hypothetical protein
MVPFLVDTQAPRCLYQAQQLPLHGPHNSNVPEFPHNDPLGGIEETPLGKGCEEASKKRMMRLDHAENLMGLQEQHTCKAYQEQGRYQCHPHLLIEYSHASN